MDLSIVKGSSPNGSRMEWVKVKTLGKGSYGVVHLVKPISDDRAFAVKTCLYKDSSSLQKELQILKEFAGYDNNIVKSYGDMVTVDHQGEAVYNLFLEYAPGGSLLNLMNNQKYGGKIPERDVRLYTKMLLEGVRDIHRRGYVHCDLKPENILVFPTPDVNRLKIADFGLVRPQGDTSHKPFPGTPVYMPPESVTDGKISTALDIWSLGCVVLEMITGQLPWPYQDMLDPYNDIDDLYDETGFSGRTPEIPEQTVSSTGKDFLMKCFQRDPTECWTADMLLCHPFVFLPADDCLSSAPAPVARAETTPKSFHHTELNTCLQAIDMCLQVLGD